MESSSELIARIRQVCIASAQDPSVLGYLLRHPLRKLLDYSSAVGHLQLEQRSVYLFSFNTAPGFIRALRLAARTVNAGATLRDVYAEGVLVVRSHYLRAISLGRHLRLLASGDFLVCGHIDTQRPLRSTFAFAGVCLGNAEQLRNGVKMIVPHLHEALLSLYLSNDRVVRGLTPAEEHVYRLLVDGLSNKEIARALNKSDATIRNQLHAIFGKLGVGTRAEAIAKQHERGFELSHHFSRPDRADVMYDCAIQYTERDSC